MVSGEKLVNAVADKTEGGILVVVDDDTFHGGPPVGAVSGVEAECVLAFMCFMVTHPPVPRQYLGVLVETPVKPMKAVPNLEPRILNVAGEPMVGTRPPEADDVRAGLEHTVDLAPELDGGHVVVPLLAHEAEAVWWVSDAGVEAIRCHRAEECEVVAAGDRDSAGGGHHRRGEGGE